MASKPTLGGSIGRGGVRSALDSSIESLNLSKNICDIPSAQAVFGSFSDLLTILRVRSLPFYSIALKVHDYAGRHS